MQRANSTGKNGTVTIVAAKPAPEGEGFMEIAILSLAGLTFALIMIAQGVFPDAATMLVQ